MEEERKSNFIVIVLIFYFLLTLISHYTSDFQLGTNMIAAIQDIDTPPPNVKNLLSIFKNQNYEGIWQINPNYDNQALTKNKGKFILQFMKMGPSDRQKYDLILDLNNGEYIDDGSVTLNFRILPQQWKSVRYNQQIHLIRKNTNKTNASASQNPNIFRIMYQHNLKLQNLNSKKINTEELKIVYKIDQQHNALRVGIQIVSKQISVTMNIARQETNMFSTITFATMLFFISYQQFSAIMSILKSIIQGLQQPINYSLLTVLGAMMWDAALCLISFMEAFRDQQNLILFIFPAFLLCLLFTNLELRLILLIYQSNSGQSNIRSIICKFNFITYGSLLLLYPILYAFNFSTIFFLLISLIFLPQIYSNGVNSQRPNIGSPYYKKFLTTRFITILYLKCFPWNIFQLEPDYVLGFGCISLLCIQMFWLWLQSVHGPRRVLPRFLMPQSYNYDYKLSKQQEQNECAICISSLGQNTQIPASRFKQPYKIMKAPCGHIYHGSCLSQWMEIKKQCPQCRKKLPAYQ